MSEEPWYSTSPPKRPDILGVPEQPVEVAEVRRFTVDDIDDWLLTRLDQRWPGYAPSSWRSRLQAWIGSNAHFIVTNGRCVLMMLHAFNHAINGKPVVVEVFAFSRDARLSLEGDNNWVIPKEAADGLPAMSAVYRAGRAWMKGLNGARMICGTCSDLAPATCKNAAGAYGYYIVDVPNK